MILQVELCFPKKNLTPKGYITKMTYQVGKLGKPPFLVVYGVCKKCFSLCYDCGTATVDRLKSAVKVVLHNCLYPSADRRFFRRRDCILIIGYTTIAVHLTWRKTRVLSRTLPTMLL